MDQSKDKKIKKLSKLIIDDLELRINNELIRKNNPAPKTPFKILESKVYSSNDLLAAYKQYVAFDGNEEHALGFCYDMLTQKWHEDELLFLDKLNRTHKKYLTLGFGSMFANFFAAGHNLYSVGELDNLELMALGHITIIASTVGLALIERTALNSYSKNNFLKEKETFLSEGSSIFKEAIVYSKSSIKEKLNRYYVD